MSRGEHPRLVKALSAFMIFCIYFACLDLGLHILRYAYRYITAP